MPITPPLVEEQDSLNAWLDQTTEEVNELRAARVVSLLELQTLTAAAADFAAFQAAIALLE